MNEAFGAAYAAAYDLIYRDKNYAAEVAAVEHGVSRFADGMGKRVLDLGCGTGRHCEVLAQRGYQVVGVERSAEMLQRARARVQGSAAGLRFLPGDIRDVRLNETFDTVLMMFAVLGYQVSNTDALAALSTARAHLKPGGTLVFDVWWGPGVLRDPPGERARWFEDRGDQVLRTAHGHLDAISQCCTVSYRVLRIRGERVVEDSREEHVMRFFFRRELELLLHATGFELARLGGFPDVMVEVDERSWNVSVIARAR